MKNRPVCLFVIQPVCLLIALLKKVVLPFRYVPLSEICGHILWQKQYNKTPAYRICTYHVIFVTLALQSLSCKYKYYANISSYYLGIIPLVLCIPYPQFCSLRIVYINIARVLLVEQHSIFIRNSGCKKSEIQIYSVNLISVIKMFCCTR